MVDEFARNDLREKVSVRGRRSEMTCVVCRFLYGVTDFGIHAIADVDNGGRFLEDTESFDQRGRESFRGAADVEVLE